MSKALIDKAGPRERDEDDAAWRAILGWRQAGRAGPPPVLPPGLVAELYAPLLEAYAAGESLIVAHLGQSLDGRIATASGASRWITGDSDLLHTHRMRALADAVVVGAGTVRADDPLLTVRRCAGPNPVRVVIDAAGRLPPTHRIFEGDATLYLTGDGAVPVARRAETIALKLVAGRIPGASILATLRRRGLRWIFVEGGGVTVSRLLGEGALDRLQLTLAPVLLGSGTPSLVLPEILDPAGGLRPRMRYVRLGDDLLAECIFR